MLSPMLRLKGVLAALLLVSASAKKPNASFLKAMEAQPSRLLQNEKARHNLMANLVAKAQPRRLDQNNVDYGEFGFDVTQYSVKYTGCSAIMTYSDEAAQESDTVLQAKRFVVFRLCLTDSCNKYDAKGCSSDYGEYVLEMGDYLETMNQYNEEKLENYCQYCEQCAGAQAEEEEAADQEEEQAEDDAGRKRRLEDAAEAEEQAAEEDAAEAEDAYATCNSVCQDYANVCAVEQEADDGAEEQEEIDIADYFECVAVDAGGDDGISYYLGPHCSDDGFSIIIGLYSDEGCSKYVGTNTSVYDATGIDLSGADMSGYYPQDCLSCLENQYEYENNGDDNADEDQVAEFCENLYMSSAKCNTNFVTVNAEAYYSAQQLANEEQVCNFIGNIVSGKYDESGDIIIDALNYNVSDWRNFNQYVNVLHAVEKEVTGGQIAGLVLSILGCFFLCIYACVLHSSLTKKGLQWKPRRGKFTDPTAISRQNSGIVMGRSRSGPNGSLV